MKKNILLTLIGALGIISLFMFRTYKERQLGYHSGLLKYKAINQLDDFLGSNANSAESNFAELGKPSFTNSSKENLEEENVIAGKSTRNITVESELADASKGAKFLSTPFPEGSKGNVVLPMVDFTGVASIATPSVVHIKTKSYQAGTNSKGGNPFGNMFGGSEGGGEVASSGSGVILSENGYLVTNRHVIEGAQEIEVVLNDRRSYNGKIIGVDRDTDIAVLKIDAKKLPSLDYGDSDKLKVGEWVMAVGNPFNLASTVTTGIVSAKARNIGITNNTMAIESFIQTDAAVNPGNSGGALVNLSGELIGINTAIATPTGFYAGYAFALPVNIVKKVVKDILEFGEVKRGFLGVSIADVNSQMADRMDFDNANGIYVSQVMPESAALEGGILEGDVIVKVGDIQVNSAAELQEMVSRYRPGDKVDITVKRDNKLQILSVSLKGVN